MNKLLKIIYGLLALALGTLISVSLIKAVVSHDTSHSDEVEEVSQFPDYVKQMNTFYDKYTNRKSHFHQTSKRSFLPMKQQENCLTCHSLWPHKKDVRTRAFNNQHSRYMSCMGCHIDEQPGRPVGFEWYDFAVDNSFTRMGPYGVTRGADGTLAAEDNFITKIVPVVMDGKIKTRIFTPYNAPRYSEYRESVDRGESVDHESVRREAEALVGGQAISCAGCHAENSSFPWENLGFKGERLDEMRHSAVVGMVEKYESFYFPSVFE